MIIETKYITPNPFSRVQYPIEEVRKIVVHWVADAGASAERVWKYFESFSGMSKYDPRGIKCGIHEIIDDKTGNVIICIPDSEIAIHCGTSNPDNYTEYATKYLRDKKHSDPNFYTYGIEMTHADWTGKPSIIQEQSLVLRLATLCHKFDLNPMDDIIIHNDVVKYPIKNCHKWYRTNPQLFEELKNKVVTRMSYDESWQQKLGEEAIDFLYENGFINNPSDWKSKNLRDINTPLWLYFEMSKRIIGKISDLENKT